MSEPSRRLTAQGEGPRTYTEGLLEEMGFALGRSYNDGVNRWSLRVNDRIELVAFVEDTGVCPLGIQVWLDGLPQTMKVDGV